MEAAPGSEKPLHPTLQPRYDTHVAFDKNNKTATEIAKRIQERGGKIPYSEFMNISLYGANGFYSAGKVEIGIGKDFITSPEASELFGTSILSVLVKTWEAMGRPGKFRVVEMGAGQAELAYSILQWAKDLYPDFSKSLQYTIVEYAENLIPRQQEKLKVFQNVQWVRGSAYELPLGKIEGAFISNELPDTFPVERVIKLDGVIKQKFVTLEEVDGREEWVEYFDDLTPEVAKFIEENNLQIQENIEEPINIKALDFQKQLDRVLKRGIILTVDYGKNGPVGRENKTAVRCMKRGEILSDVTNAYQFAGNADITSSIDFSILAKQAKQDGWEMAFSGLQKDFLTKAGVARMIDVMEKIAKTTKSWNELIRMCKSLSGYHLIRHITGNYYTFLVSKGIKVDDLSLNASKERLLGQIPEIPIRLPKPTTAYLIDPPLPGVTEYEPGSYVINGFSTDAEGRLWLKPHLLEGRKILNVIDREIVLDFTQEEDLAIVAKEAGYEL